MITELNENNFDEYIKTGLKVVEFYAKWCTYCQKEHAVICDLSNNINFGQVDGDENFELIKRYGITGFPTFIVFKDGRIVNKLIGYQEKSQLLAKLNESYS